MINRYSISKTLRFKLIPVGNTEENFIAKKLLEDDSVRAENYKNAKAIIDDFHKTFINKVLSQPFSFDLKPYYELFYKANKSEKEKKELRAYENEFRKQIAKALKKGNNFDKLFKKELFTDLLPDYIKNEEDKQVIKSFDNFVTYFSGFFNNRKNLYSDEEKSTAVAYRCINDNLPRFLDNCRSYKRIKEYIKDKLNEYNNEVYSLLGFNIDDLFELDYFGFVLSQKGIDKYNQVIGGYTNSDGTKVQGINEMINLYNQTVEKKDRLPTLKILYKQLLSDRESISFIPESIKDDNELLGIIREGYSSLLNSLGKYEKDFVSFTDYANEYIFINNDYISAISQKLTGNWSTVADEWNKEYDAQNPKKAKNEKYYDNRKRAYKIHAFSISEIEKLIKNYFTENNKTGSISVSEKLTDEIKELFKSIKTSYADAEKLLTEEYNDTKKLAKNDFAIEQIKALLDSIKNLEYFIKQFMVADIGDKDERFYGEITPLYDKLRDFGRLYDRVRNYITKKPYSKDKIKLNFENPQFLNGWDRNKEKDYRSVLLKKGNSYYLAIMDKASNKSFEDYPETNSNGWEKINYKLLPGPNKMLPKVFFAKSRIDDFEPSNEIIRIREEETFKKGDKFNKSDCEKLIDFYKDSLSKNEEWRDYGFDFKKTSDYNDIAEFYNDVRTHGYKINYSKISEDYIMNLVDEGKIYLYRLYCKDFSEHSKGTPNLHTLYFKMLFDERNLNDVVYKLNGEAEMFYRIPSLSIGETTVHKAHEPIKNKNELNVKKTSTFDYDLIKDKRFTEGQYSIHIPITLNFKSQGMDHCNNDVRAALKECKDNYVIGIDRGERNLLYVCVINSKGEIVEQYSLNEIINEYNGVPYKTDYHDLLDEKEKKRDEARKNWTTIEGIKELKEGYISQVVHKICELVVQYDAVISMEDLNMGFKNSRAKVEKQVYQKFEKMLIDKLNYLVVDKNMDPEEKGGLLNAYQLTEKFVSFKRMGKQNGFIFYVPAWLTSKIDPVTGFADLLKPKYESVEKAKSVIESFDFVRYNNGSDMFEIGLDYYKTERGITSYKKKWTICTNGNRIRLFRNKAKNNEWDDETVYLTEAFKKLFNEHGIDISADIKEQLLAKTDKELFENFVKLLSLTLQMRNSIPNSDIDYLISPVRGKDGKFFCSDDYQGKNALLPENADANGAYNIARKALWCIEQIKAADDDKLDKVKLAIKNKEWLEYAQKG